MTVFVDDMHAKPMGRLRRMKMSHMIADTEEELHAMARRIGVAREHYQEDHYDISLAKRALAVAAGAVEITMRQCGLMRSNRIATGVLGDPATALAVRRARMSRVTPENQAGGIRSAEPNGAA